MSSNYSVPEGKDPQIWEQAHRRVEFRKHFQTYLVVNAFLWVLWFLGNNHQHQGLPWPVWPTAGWGIGVFFHYLNAYNPGKGNAVESEYNKLINHK
jgi:hypothetical protein